MERLVSRDFTDESVFLDEKNKWCFQEVNNNNMNLISGKKIGTITNTDKPVIIQDLLGRDYIDFNNNLFGIYIPQKELLRRTAYNWFCYLKEDELLNSEMIISKYMVLSHAQ